MRPCPSFSYLMNTPLAHASRPVWCSCLFTLRLVRTKSLTEPSARSYSSQQQRPGHIQMEPNLDEVNTLCCTIPSHGIEMSDESAGQRGTIPLAYLHCRSDWRIYRGTSAQTRPHSAVFVDRKKVLKNQTNITRLRIRHCNSVLIHWNASDLLLEALSKAPAYLPFTTAPLLFH